MAIEVISTADAVQESGIKVLVHGQAGSGKTRLCATTGELDRTIIVSAEGGLMSLSDYDIDAIEIRTLDEFREARQYLQRNQSKYRWVILDSISEIAEVVLSYEKGQTNDGRRAYGEMADRVWSIIRDFRNLRANVVLLAKQGREESNGSTYFAPMLPGQQLTQNISYLFDEVLALRVGRESDGTLTRWLQTQRDREYEAKDRSGALEPQEPADLSVIHGKIVEATGGRAGEPPEPDPAEAHDDPRRQKITGRIKALIDEAELDVEAVWPAFVAWTCETYEVDAWRWLEVEQLIDLGKSVSGFSAKGGRLSPRRLWLWKWTRPHLEERLADEPGWTATGGESDDWTTVNKRWRSVVAEAADGQETRRQYHEALKARHDVGSFNDLTLEDIMRDVDRLEKRAATHPEGGMPERVDYIKAEIEKHIPQSESFDFGHNADGDGETAGSSRQGLNSRSPDPDKARPLKHRNARDYPDSWTTHETPAAEDLPAPHAKLVRVVDDVAGDMRDAFVREVVLPDAEVDALADVPAGKAEVLTQSLLDVKRGVPEGTCPLGQSIGCPRRELVEQFIKEAREAAESPHEKLRELAGAVVQADAVDAFCEWVVEMSTAESWEAIEPEHLAHWISLLEDKSARRPQTGEPSTREVWIRQRLGQQAEGGAQ